MIRVTGRRYEYCVTGRNGSVTYVSAYSVDDAIAGAGLTSATTGSVEIDDDARGAWRPVWPTPSGPTPKGRVGRGL